MTAESAISCGGLGAGQHGYGSHICRDPLGSDEQLGTGTAAGLPRLELDWELFAHGRFSVDPAARSSTSWPARRPVSRAGTATLLSEGRLRPASCTSSKPITRTSRSHTATRCRQSHPGRRRRPRR